APSATVSPTSLTFGSASVGTTSAAQLVSVTNTGFTALDITVAKGGADPLQFTQPNGCNGVHLLRGLTCTISVAFAPTSSGAKTASLTIGFNGAVPDQTVTLAGTGVA